MNINILYILIIIICWTINPFIKKIISKKIPGLKYNFSSTITVLTLIMLIIFFTNYISTNENIDINFFNTLDNNELMLLVFGGIISLVPAYLFIILVHEYEISFLEPVLHSSAILLTAIIGSVIFNETFGIYKFIGIISVIIGIFLLSYEQK
jgi:uncharacterized membrane protein